jgi:hypothetical protein
MQRTAGLLRERISMFYVILIVIAALIFAALYFIRGRRTSA